MISIFRQHQRKLMLVVAILTIIAFAFFYNPAEPSQLGSNKVGRIYDRELTQADIDRLVRSYQLAMAMDETGFVGALGGLSQNRNRAVVDFVFNLLVLRHEARALGIEPTDVQVAERLQQFPAFQTDGRYDREKYQAFVSEHLFPQGLNVEQLWNMTRDALRLASLEKIVGSPAAVNEAEVKDASRVLQKVDVQVIRFSPDEVADKITVTEEEVTSFRDRNQDAPELSAPETRTVEFVEFALDPAATPGDARQTTEAVQKLAETAVTFAEKAASTSLADAAAAQGLKVRTSPAFDREGKVDKPAEDADSLVASLKEVGPAAFLLTEQAPVSDVIQSDNRFFVIKLAGITPSRPLSLEEVRPLAESRIRALKAIEVVRAGAEEKLARLREAMQGGKSFEEARTVLGLKVESLKELDFETGGLTADRVRILRVTIPMEPGQLTGYLPTPPDGGLAVYLAARAPLDPAVFASQEATMRNALLEGKRQLLFLTWLGSARENSKWSLIQRPRGQ